MEKINIYERNAINQIKDMTEYELWALNFFRSKFQVQADSIYERFTFKESDRSRYGKLIPHTSGSANIVIGNGLVSNSLNYFVPLAFGLAFKLQDMVIQWILEHNRNRLAKSRGKGGFEKKIFQYSNLLKNKEAEFPSYFAKEPILNETFFALYETLKNYRNELIHGSEFSSNNEGLGIIKGNDKDQKLVLTPKEQAGYYRSCCLVVEGLLNPDEDSLQNILAVKADFVCLKRIHNVQKLVEPFERLVTIRFILDIQGKISTPYSCLVDLDELINRVKEIYRQAKTEQPNLLFSLVVEAHTLKEVVYEWDIPPSKVPMGGIIRLTEGDPKFDQFLRISAK